MAEEDKIKYSDIIQPDDSINKLIEQLSELNKLYESTVNAIRSGADKIASAMKSASGATSEGRKSIDSAAQAASRLERAYDELEFAMSDTGKMVTQLRTEIRAVNKETSDNYRYINQAVGSYDRLKSELRQSVDLYKSLTAAERTDSEMGQQLLNDIINLKNQIKELDNQLKPHVQALTEVEKAEQKLAYLQSAEGQRLLELKRQIAEVTSGRKQEKAAVDPLVTAQEKLAYAQSDENQQLKLYSTQIQEANRVAQLQAQIAASAEGSYNRLSAQYALNKIRLNEMSGAQRQAADTGKKLEEETKAIYLRMREMQEVTGNYTLSVGNYEKAWNGLGFSVAQVVRELPSAAVSLNTFFLAISNNIPMLIDEIQKLRIQNKLLATEGKPTVSVAGQLAKSFLSWNTALVIVLTLLSAFGKEIIQFTKNLFSGEKAALSFREAIRNINKELEQTNNNFGSTKVDFMDLKREYIDLRTEAEKTQWIKDNEGAFNQLGIAVENVIEADNLFIENTPAMIRAMQLRAKAAAAQKLAAEQYEKALIAQSKADAEAAMAPSGWDRFRNTLVQSFANGATDAGPMIGPSPDMAAGITAEDFQQQRIKGLEAEAKAAEEAGDAYYDYSDKYNDAADAILKAAGIRKAAGKEEEDEGKRMIDLTDRIYRMRLSVQKKYEASIADLERDEFEQRRTNTINAANEQIRQLQETYRKNEEWLADPKNRYEELTDEQVQMIKQSQEEIRQTIVNEQEQLAYELEQIEKDRLINEQQLLDEAIQMTLQSVQAGSQEELDLVLQSIDAQEKIALLQNSKLPTSQRQKETDIKAGFNKQRTQVTVEFIMTGFEQAQELEAAVFNSVEQNQRDITRFQLQQEKERWEKQIALAKAGALDWSDAQIKAAEATVNGIGRQLTELDDFFRMVGEQGLGATILEKLGFSDRQVSAIQEATAIVVDSLGQILDAEVELAQAAVDAAQERTEAAKEALDAEIEARNNGYANAVTTARMELAEEQRKQAQKESILADAQKRQQQFDSIIQASSLITASANLWSSFSGIPIVGPALAIAAIATMWGSFIAAKAKAAQVTQQTQQYGEGGLEFLEGGSHASGNDIDLGVNNGKKKRMKAEGGEALAIINKKQTRKYRKVLPDVIESFNKGIFEEKYANAFSNSSNIIVNNERNSIDLSKIEKDVAGIRKQNEIQYFVMPNGTVIMQKGNVKRIIKKR